MPVAPTSCMPLITRSIGCPFEALIHPFTQSLWDPVQTKAGPSLVSNSSPQSAPFPRLLWARGEEFAFDLLDDLPRFGFAIVGTRQAQPASKQFIADTLERLAQHPFGRRLIIVSGLARGIDAAAHAAAVEFGLRTVAWLGTPLDQQYPRQTLQLRSQILKAGGLLLTHLPPGSPVFPSHFLLRNRSIVASSSAVWIAQAGIPSGALSTAQWALELDRPCFATPSFPGDPAFEGNQKLLDKKEAAEFWGGHSLGSVWLELATLGLRPKRLGIAQALEKMLQTSNHTDDSGLEIHYKKLAALGYSRDQILEAFRLRADTLTTRINIPFHRRLEKREEFRLD